MCTVGSAVFPPIWDTIPPISHMAFSSRFCITPISASLNSGIFIRAQILFLLLTYSHCSVLFCSTQLQATCSDWNFGISSLKDTGHNYRLVLQEWHTVCQMIYTALPIFGFQIPWNDSTELARPNLSLYSVSSLYHKEQNWVMYACKSVPVLQHRVMYEIPFLLCHLLTGKRKKT